MSEDADQKTEDPTQRKKEKLHEEGQIPKSQDVGAAVVVLATCTAIGYSFDTLARLLASYTERMFRFEDSTRPLHAIRGWLEVLAPVFIPLMVASVSAAIAGGVQTRTFSFNHLAPKPERFNPLPQLMQMLPTKQGLIEIGKQVLKLVAIGYIAYDVIADATPMFSTLSNVSPLDSAAVVADVVGTLVVKVSIAFFVAAALDYYLARHKFTEDAKMSRQEIRDEHKQEEGRPEVKGRMRARMRDMSKNRSMNDVAKATVLVVNPTHYAVALRYLPERDSAPMVVAKGADEIALAMRAVARRERVPIVEQRVLARSLYTAKVGRPIPVELYRAVAEVIAFVMQLRARDAGAPPLTAADLPEGAES